jgi:hypothetical protein
MKTHVSIVGEIMQVRSNRLQTSNRSKNENKKNQKQIGRADLKLPLQKFE